MAHTNSQLGANSIDPPSDTCSSYLTTSQMDSFFPPLAFNIMSLNTRSLGGKFDSLKDYICATTTKFSVIALQEVWSAERHFPLPGFHPLQAQTRDQGGLVNTNCGGGAGIFVSKSFDMEPLPELNTFLKGIYESVWLLITDKGNKKGQKLLIGSIYRPDTAPRADISLALKAHESILSQISKNKKLKKCKIFICSDFNLDLKQALSSQTVSDYITTHSTHNLNSLVTISAHPTPTSSKLIDHIFSNSTKANCKTGVLIEHFSDHLPLILSDTSVKLSELLPDPPSRNFSKTNIKTYLSLLKTATFTIDPTNPKNSFDSFFNIITEAAHISFPLKLNKKGKRPKTSPWITKGLVKSAATKKILFSARLKSPSPESRESFSSYNKIFVKCVKKAKKMHYLESFKASIKDHKATWSLINEVTGRDKPSSSLPSTFSIPLSSSTANPLEPTTSDPKEIVSGFNNFFSSIGLELASKIDQTKFPDNHFSKFLGPKSENDFELLPVTVSQLLNIVKELKNKSSAGSDLLSNSLLKVAIPLIADHLRKLINLSFTTGYVPEQMRIAKVTPLHKEGDKSSFNNYRPIAVISSIGKVIEKVVHHQLYGYLEANNILTPSQFGFRSRHGVEHPLVLFANRVTSSLNKGKHNMSLFIDLKKAFDTVSFPILLAKLKHYGVRGRAHLWFQNYLKRLQYVIAGGVLSELVEMLCGIPQGTVLGPLLFLIFVNDLALATRLWTLLFADDCTLQGEHENIDQLFIHMNTQLSVAEKWFSANLLTLNIKKTKFLLFTATPTLQESIPELRIGENVLDRVGNDQPEKAVRFLGVWIDESFTFRHHIGTLKGKLARGIHALSSAKDHSPIAVRKSIYFALFESYIRFGSLMYGCATDGELRDIEILQKRAVRLVAGAHYRAHTTPLFQSLKILKLTDIIFLERVTFVHKYRHNKLPDAFSQNFLNLVDGDNLLRRQDPGQYTPLPNNHRLTSRSPISRLITDWNSLPYPTKCISCHKAFKSDVIVSILSSYTFHCTEISCRSCYPLPFLD